MQIRAGSTNVRVGSTIFGTRDYSDPEKRRAAEDARAKTLEAQVAADA